MNKRIRKYSNRGFYPIARKLEFEDTARAENRLGIRFPADYNSFLSLVNGGVPREKWLTIHTNLGTVVFEIKKFYAINAINSWDDLIDVNRNVQDRTPPGCIVVATDGVDEFALCCHGALMGRMFLLPWMNSDSVVISAETSLSDCFWMFVEMLKAKEPKSTVPSEILRNLGRPESASKSEATPTGTAPKKKRAKRQR
jgi:hypothetical protein